MKPQQELNFLKGFIKLTEEQATKRNNLEAFCGGKSKILLVDADSMLFNVVHSHSKDFKDTGKLDIFKQYEDFNKQIEAVCKSVELDGFEVGEVVYFFTTCNNNFRKKLLPSYKANRPKNQMGLLVSLLKGYVIEQLELFDLPVFYSDTLEADDLISQHDAPINDRIIVAIDKDLKQIEGAHFDYYKKKLTDSEGLPVMGWVELNSGENVYIQKKDFKGWSYTTKKEGFIMLMAQLLIGDNADNIKGVDKIGVKKAAKLLEGKNNFGALRAVFEAYNDKDRLKLNINLMKL